MVSRAVQTALARLWTDRCTIYGQKDVSVLGSHLTNFQPVVLAEDVPCKLSFESLTVTTGDGVATVGQSVKLFLALEVQVFAGCKIVVTRPDGTELTYGQSGLPGVFHNHQEILLEPFRGWA